MTLTTTDNHIWCSLLSDFVFHVGTLVCGLFSLFPGAVLFILPVPTVIVNCCMAASQLGDEFMDVYHAQPISFKLCYTEMF
ncbi:hypothetical protein SARO104761_11950 [Salinicoccus roseus]